MFDLFNPIKGQPYNGSRIGAGALTGLTLVFIAWPTEHGICIDPHVWCAPPPVAMGDEPAGDGPAPLRGTRSPVVFGSSLSTVSLSNGYIRLA
jgi:hypothetical protein